jgi:glycosyltransferase involved in cell wall biosynthesis
VRTLGYVTPEQLAALYYEASLLAFPSRFEGYGIPVVEAMSAGCPVVVADATALPALVRGSDGGRDAGVVVDPDDVAGWAHAITHLLADTAHRRRLALAGRARAASLAAADPVQRLVDVYLKAAG